VPRSPHLKSTNEQVTEYVSGITELRNTLAHHALAGGSVDGLLVSGSKQAEIVQVKVSENLSLHITRKKTRNTRQH